MFKILCFAVPPIVGRVNTLMPFHILAKAVLQTVINAPILTHASNVVLLFMQIMLEHARNVIGGARLAATHRHATLNVKMVSGRTI